MADMFRGQTPIRRTNPKPGEYAMNKFLSKIPIVGTYINGIANGQKIGSSVANIYMHLMKLIVSNKSCIIIMAHYL